MRRNLTIFIILILVFAANREILADHNDCFSNNNPDTVATVSDLDTIPVLKQTDKIEWVNILIYNRTIIDNNGQARFDQSVVPTFGLSKNLELQLGMRIGERPDELGAYYHYKAELRTRYFRNRFRFFARMSNNLVRYTDPSFTKSNYMLVAEGRYPFGPKFTVLGGIGYIDYFRKEHFTEGGPVFKGKGTDYLLYRFSVRYAFSKSGFLELAHGLYDVFNPYNPREPVTQLAIDYNLSERIGLYSYLRYQQKNHFDQMLNVFHCIGVRLRFFKK